VLHPARVVADLLLTRRTPAEAGLLLRAFAPRHTACVLTLAPPGKPRAALEARA
jgi:hypothetical protein